MSTENQVQTQASIQRQVEQLMAQNSSASGAEILARVLVGNDAFDKIVQGAGSFFISREDLSPIRLGKAWEVPLPSASGGSEIDGDGPPGSAWGGPDRPGAEEPDSNAGGFGAGWK